MYLLNALSLMMVPPPCTIAVKEVSLKDAREQDFESALGHADTALLISSLLGREYLANRVQVRLGVGDCAMVAQYTGPRLPEGATALPEGAEIKWLLVTVLGA